VIADTFMRYLQPHPRPVMSTVDLSVQIVRADPATEAIESEHLWWATATVCTQAVCRFVHELYSGFSASQRL
jgi:hypothetical protein